MPKQTSEVSFAGTKFEGKTEDQVRNALYNQGLQALRNEHPDEFVKIVTDLFAAHGLTYRRRLTEAERAEQQARALFAAHPGLADRLVDVFPAAEVEDVSEVADI